MLEVPKRGVTGRCHEKSFPAFPVSCYFFVSPLAPLFALEAFKSFETSVATAQKGTWKPKWRGMWNGREKRTSTPWLKRKMPLKRLHVKGGERILLVNGGHGSPLGNPAHPPFLGRFKRRVPGLRHPLVQVAEGPSNASEEQNALAAAINQSLRDAGSTIVQVKDRPNLLPASAAAFSSESLLSVKRYGRAKTLRSAVQKNQSWVESYSTHCLTSSTSFGPTSRSPTPTEWKRSTPAGTINAPPAATPSPARSLI
jgi:hypothetical protein